MERKNKKENTGFVGEKQGVCRERVRVFLDGEICPRDL